MNDRLVRATAGRVIVGLVALLILAFGMAACGDDDDATATADSSAQSTDDSAVTDDSSVDDETAALVTASDELVTVCRDQDRDRLRDLTGDSIRDRIRDQDQLFSSVDDVTVLSREVSIDGDTATVTVTLEVTIDGETSEVERVWVYERIDGSWVLSEVPDCIFS